MAGGWSSVDINSLTLSLSLSMPVDIYGSPDGTLCKKNYFFLINLIQQFFFAYKTNMTHYNIIILFYSRLNGI